MRVDRHPVRQALLTLLFAMSLAACAVTAEDIDTWTGTVKGPGKIVAVLLADKYADDLRVRAGLALVRMERQDVEGVSELQSALRRLDDDTRRRIVDGMAPTLLSMMHGEGEAPVAEGAQPPPLQLRAKDASFLVLQYASPEQQTQLTDGVVGWFVVDFNARNLAGSFSAEQVIRQLGAPAASRLVDALSSHLPQAALVKLAELIAALGDDATKARAAARLVEVEQEMEGAEFTAWLGSRITAQRASQQQPALPADILARAVAMNRETFITQGAIPAMHHLGTQAAAADRLLAMARVASTDAPGEDRRVTSLMALEGHVRPDQASALIALALDPTTPVRVRDYAFDRIADSHSREAIPQLWPMATSAESAGMAWRQRWRVGSLILTLAGNDLAIATEWFNRLPSSREVAFAREELHGYADRVAAMRPEPSALIAAQLASADWWDRAIALYYYERNGTEADLARIQAVAADAAPTHGEHWLEHDTVGKIAQDVVVAIRERLSRGAAPAAAGAGAGG